jgi:hypothetical protein
MKIIRIFFNRKDNDMIEILTLFALLLLLWLLRKFRNKQEKTSTEKYGSNYFKQQQASIVGESRFVLSDVRVKKTDSIEPDSDVSGKMEIEVLLDYETEDSDLQEEQEALESFGLQNDFSKNITFEEMMLVVNEVGNDKIKTTPHTGKLLYENENTEWVEQLSLTSNKNASRITALIDLHLEKLEQPVSDVNDDEFRGFDIGKYVK